MARHRPPLSGDSGAKTSAEELDRRYHERSHYVMSKKDVPKTEKYLEDEYERDSVIQSHLDRSQQE